MGTQWPPGLLPAAPAFTQFYDDDDDDDDDDDYDDDNYDDDKCDDDDYHESVGEQCPDAQGPLPWCGSAS